MSFLLPKNWLPGKKEEKKEEKKGIEETEPETETEEETEEETEIEEETPEQIIIKQLSTQYTNKKPLDDKITSREKTKEATPTETQTETPTETPTETETEETKKIVPKKAETKIITKIADSVESFIKHDKPLIDTINDLREGLTVLPEDRKYEIVEYIARELANATDAEGNKLFKDETEAKQFLHTISTKTPNLRYKLPIEIQKEIKEKTPKILTSLTQRNIRSIGAANKNIYQY